MRSLAERFARKIAWICDSSFIIHHSSFIPCLLTPTAHFNHARFADDLAETMTRARQAGVSQMVVVGFDMASSEQAVSLSERHPGVLFAAVGVHPHDAKDWDAGAEARLRTLADHPHVIAIGEIGLDFHHNFSPLEAQNAAVQGADADCPRLGTARDYPLPRSVSRNPANFKRGRRRRRGRRDALLGGNAGAGGRNGRARPRAGFWWNADVQKRGRTFALPPAIPRWNPCFWKPTRPT